MVAFGMRINAHTEKGYPKQIEITGFKKDAEIIIVTELPLKLLKKKGG